jgi:hypothetical protein
MFEQSFRPLERQFDSGHHAIGDAFMDAAVKLTEIFESNLVQPQAHLPVNYLYRHAIELFLKSSILTIHRALQLPTGNAPHTPDPMIAIGKDSKPLWRVHSVLDLLEEVDRLIAANEGEFAKRCVGEWRVPAELRDLITKINEYDASSTYFRYPSTKTPHLDAQKSGVVKADPIEVLRQAWARDGREPPVVPRGPFDFEVFVLQNDPQTEFRDVLIAACRWMSGYAFGLHCDLVDGIGSRIRERERKGPGDETP